MSGHSCTREYQKAFHCIIHQIHQTHFILVFHIFVWKQKFKLILTE